MTNVPDDNRRRPILLSTDRHLWRYELFQHIRTRRRYTNLIIADLRPLWNEALVESEPDDKDALGRAIYELGIHKLRARAEHDVSRSALRAYLEGLNALSVDVLRLTMDGKPTRWASEFVHVDVESRAATGDEQWPSMPRWSSFFGGAGYDPVPPGSEPWDIFFEDIRIEASPMSGRVLRGFNPHYGSLPATASTVVPAKYLDRFNEWELLRRAAYTMVDQVIGDFKAEYLRKYPGQNPTTPKKLKEDANAFAAYLLTDTHPVNRADGTRLRRFANRIGADYPAHKK